MSIVFLFDEKPTVVPVGSAGEQSGGAQEVPYGAVRSNSERAAPSARVGNRFWAPQIVWNRSTRRAGAAGRQAQMAEDLDDYRRIFDGGDALQAAAAVGAVFHVDIEDPFEQSGPVHAWYLSLRVSVLA